jgi:hypothetical protein
MIKRTLDVFTLCVCAYAYAYAYATLMQVLQFSELRLLQWLIRVATVVTLVFDVKALQTSPPLPFVTALMRILTSDAH